MSEVTPQEVRRYLDYPARKEILDSKKSIRNRPVVRQLYSRGCLTNNQRYSEEYIKAGYLIANSHPPKGLREKFLFDQYKRWLCICNRDMVNVEEIIHIIIRNASLMDTAYYFEKNELNVRKNLNRGLKLFASLFLDDMVTTSNDGDQSMQPEDIKKIRLDANMSVKDMANHLDCNARFVRQLETPVEKKSHRTPSENIISKLLEIKNNDI